MTNWLCGMFIVSSLLFCSCTMPTRCISLAQLRSELRPEAMLLPIDSYDLTNTVSTAGMDVTTLRIIVPRTATSTSVSNLQPNQLYVTFEDRLVENLVKNGVRQLTSLTNSFRRTVYSDRVSVSKVVVLKNHDQCDVTSINTVWVLLEVRSMTAEGSVNVNDK